MKSFSFLKGLSWLLLLNVLVKPVWILVIDREVQNTVGHAAYGRYFALLNLALVCSFLADAGLTNTLNQRIAAQKPVDAVQFLRLKILLLFFYVAVTLLAAAAWGIDNWHILFYILGIQVLNASFLFLRGLITGHQHFRPDAFFSVIDKLLVILFAAPVLYGAGAFGTMSLTIFLQLQLGATALALLSAVVYVAREGLWLRGEQLAVRRILAWIAPFAAAVFLMSLQGRMDGFLLERLHAQGAVETGRYAAAFRLLDVTNMVGYLAASFLVPFAARHHAQGKSLAPAVLLLRHGLALFALGVISFAAFHAATLQDWLYHSRDPYISALILLVLCVLPAYLLMHLYGSLLTATVQFRPLILVLAGSAALNLVLNFIWIPRHGAQGSAWAALISQYAGALAVAVVATRRLSLPVHPRSLAAYVLAGLLLAGFFYVAKNLIHNVWLILALGVTIMLLLLATQIPVLKKLIVSLR